MNDFDDKLAKALETGKPVDLPEEETFRQMIAQSFRSKMRWMIMLLYVEGFAICGVIIWAAMKLYAAQEIKQMIVYSMTIILCAVVMVIIKVIGWQQMNRASLMREIKRLELQLVRLQNRE